MSKTLRGSHAAASRRVFLAWSALSGATLLIGACQQRPAVYAAEVHVDAGCSCCHAWAEILKSSSKFKVTVIDDADIVAFKSRVGVPKVLAACHTAIIDNLIVEGHVPIADILRLLEERPPGVTGIGVVGMPRGSPGMEQPNGAVDPYEVMTFSATGVGQVFARYSAQG